MFRNAGRRGLLENKHYMTVSEYETSTPSPSASVREVANLPSRDVSRWLLLSAVLVLYIPVVVETAHIWLTDEYAAHGFLIPFLAGLLAWWRKREIANVGRGCHYGGFVLLIGGLLLEMVAWYARIRVFAMLSLVPVLLGMSLLLGGTRITRILLFPILFLGFAAPLPIWLVQPVSFPIQNLSCRAAAWSVQQMGVPVSQEGFTVGLTNGSAIEVAEECSGFKKTLTVTVFACFYASLFAIPFWKQCVFTLLAMPLAIVANIIRVAGLILAANAWGMSGVHRLHGMADPFVVGLCFVLLLWAGKMLGCRKLRYSV